MDVLFQMEMDDATIVLMDLEELKVSANLELNIANSISKMVLVKNAILNILWYSANANTTHYLGAKLNNQTILVLNATSLLPSKIVNALLRTARPITISDVFHANVDFISQIAGLVLRCRKAALNTIEVFVLNAFLTSSLKEVHVWFKVANNTRMDFANHAPLIMNFPMEYAHLKTVLIGKMTPALYVKMDSIFLKENVNQAWVNSFAQDDRLWYCLILWCYLT